MGEHYLQRAYELDPNNEDILIELGIVKINIHNIEYEKSKDGEKGNQRLLETFDCFYKATELNINNSRSAYMLFRTLYEFHEKEDEVDIIEIMHAIGYADKGDTSEVMIKKIKYLISEYLSYLFLPNYLANVYDAIGVLYYDVLREKFPQYYQELTKEATEYIEMAIETTKNLRKAPSGTGFLYPVNCIYAISSETIYRLYSAKDFIDLCENHLASIEKGESILERKDRDRRYNLLEASPLKGISS
jgi:hypothetical protein